jgi:EmrB/QacA subfamily drug resistance transporter
MSGPPRAPNSTASPVVRLASAPGRWLIVAAVLASGTVFLESTVVSVALPAIAADLHFGLAGMQWVMNGYLLTLGALMLSGGALGDVVGYRRVLMAGLAAFVVGCAAAALAPSAGVLLAVRLFQGASGALLVPNTLAMLNDSFGARDRGAAIGHWAAWSAISTAIGPLAGGWIVQSLSWRWVFGLPMPLALGALWIAARKIASDAPRRQESGPMALHWAARIDLAGALFVTAGLAVLTWTVVAAPARGAGSPVIVAGWAVGGLLLAAFALHEARARRPMLPLRLFASWQFTGANVVTLIVYTALGALFFLLMIELQRVLHYGALAAGASLLPINVAMLLISPAAGRVGSRIGPRWPIAGGALLVAVGMALLARVGSGGGYLSTVLPGVVVFGLGLAVLVAPLTSAVLSGASDDRAGIASAVNNAVSRLSGLIAIAALPLAAGLGAVRDADGAAFSRGFAHAMWISAACCVVGAAVALATIQGGARVPPLVHPHPQHGCLDYRSPG